MSQADPQFALYQEACSALGVADYSRRIIHYTSLDAFQGILAGKELWFGKLSDMNDAAECSHFMDGVVARLPSLITEADQPGITQILPALIPLIRDQTYISSWCEYFEAEPEGRLNMWLNYADRGAGVGLVVDSSQFQPSAITPTKLGFHVMTAKMEYVRQERAIDLANDYFLRMSNVGYMRRLFAEKMFVAGMLAAKAPCVKHQSFAEDREMRFLYMPGLLGLFGRQLPQPTMRRVGEREFFAFSLQNYAKHGLDLRIERLLKKVVIGPGRDRAGRAQTVRTLLDAHGLQNVAIEQSDIPLAA